MMKANINSDEKKALDFIEELKSNPLLENEDINLNNANQYALYLEEFNNCQNCLGLNNCKNANIGYKMVVDNNQFMMEPCKYKKEAINKSKENNLIKTLFVSKSILSSYLENLDLTTPNRRKIMEYINTFISKIKLNQFKKGLYIYGGFSTGKTFILGCIANELAKNNISSLVIYFPDLVVELKNAIGTQRLEELVNYLKSVDVLLLDDLGSENMTPWLRDEILGPVLNYRLMEEKPIFVSSNLNPTDSEFINHISITKAPSDVLKASRIKSRLEGLVIPIELENNAYLR